MLIYVLGLLKPSLISRDLGHAPSCRGSSSNLHLGHDQQFTKEFPVDFCYWKRFLLGFASNPTCGAYRRRRLCGAVGATASREIG